MLRIVSSVAVAAALVGASSGCVGKMKFDSAMAEERSLSEAELAAEAKARETGDQRLEAQMKDQQADLRALEARFDTQVTVLEDRIRFAMPLTFETDSADLGADTAALDRFATVVNQYYAGQIVTIQGYADPAGSAAHNRELSQRRAEAVRAYLVAEGLDGENLRAVGFGEAFPVAPGAAGETEGADQNRRVVFVIEGAQAPDQVSQGKSS